MPLLMPTSAFALLNHFNLIELCLIRNKHSVITFADGVGKRELNFAEYEEDEKRCRRTNNNENNQ